MKYLTPVAMLAIALLLTASTDERTNSGTMPGLTSLVHPFIRIGGHGHTFRGTTLLNGTGIGDFGIKYHRHKFINLNTPTK